MAGGTIGGVNPAGRPPSKRFQAVPPPGPEPVPITVQWHGNPEGGDRLSRRAALRKELESALASHPGPQVDWGTVSLSAQTVAGEIPADRLKAVVGGLEAAGLRVDLDFDRRLPEPKVSPEVEARRKAGGDILRPFRGRFVGQKDERVSH